MSPKYAYATLITRPSYLAGVILFAYTLRQHTTGDYPLIVLYTASLPRSCINALSSEAKYTNLILHRVEPLLPDSISNRTTDPSAESLADAWTKLRVFELYDFDYEKISYLDPDTTIHADMDRIFSLALPPPDSNISDSNSAEDFLAAAPACTCNSSHDSHVPSDQDPANCPYISHTQPSAPTPASASDAPPRPLPSTSTFVFHPSHGQWDRIQRLLSSSASDAPESQSEHPDQAFLSAFFRDRWVRIPWNFDAPMTLRVTHPDLWSDKEVVGLRYGAEKPWVRWAGKAASPGDRGEDGDARRWWWEQFGRWETEREEAGEGRLMEEVRRYVANADGSPNAYLAALGSGVQAITHNSSDSEANPDVNVGDDKRDAASQKKDEQKSEDAKDDQCAGGLQLNPQFTGGPHQVGSHESGLGRKVLGERGHGPVERKKIHPKGRSYMEP